MKRNILTLISIFSFVLFSFSQELISKDELRLKSNLSERRESIPIVNSLSNELSLFIADRKDIYFNKYNSGFEIIDQQKFERPKSKAKNILEKVNSGENKYLFLLSDDSKKKMELIKINTKKAKIELITTTILSEKERFLKAFTYKNQIFILAIPKKTSILNINKIKPIGEKETLTYDLTNEEFFDKYDKITSLYKSFLISQGGISKAIFDTEYIEEGIPNSLEVTSKPIKLYRRDNSIIVTLDVGNKYTQVLTLNLDTVNYKISNIKKPVLQDINKTNKAFIKSNSFLSRNRLYQIIGIRGQMKFKATDLTSNEIIKEIALGRKDTITFKNTPIIQEGAMYNGYREMEKTQKFLRKIASGKIGVSAHYIKDTIQLTLGGVKEIRGGGAPMVGFGFGAVGGAAFGVANAFATPTYYAYASYASTISTRIHCLFDEQMSHLEGEVPTNAFDKIKDFSEDIYNEKAETVFKFNGYYVYGYYDSLLHKYFLRKFED
ncbi:hypothetical protein [Aquimarina sp. AU119]|uniref:hypothetical protein n=1 Tax=Aquimarina sp. AU119 TaxID=2108528 RepID=UPI000D690B9C|nr:hypothetical protein [Aquimarina sp. AU119]